MNLLFEEAMKGDTQERTFNCGLHLCDIKSLLPGEELNDKVCKEKLKTVSQEANLMLSAEPLLA